MTATDIATLLEGRVSANLFDPAVSLAVAEVEELVHLATRAPSAYNLQNWRFVAVTSPEAKARLRSGGALYWALRAITGLMYLDVLAFGRLQSGPFFARLRKREEVVPRP